VSLRCRRISLFECRAPLTIHFGGQANLFDSGLRHEKAALASTKADFPSLPEYKNILLAAQKQLLELPCILISQIGCLIGHNFVVSHSFPGFPPHFSRTDRLDLT
jgi:hypothetical protein